MMRLGTVFWLVLVLAAGFTTFKVKYAIQDTEDQLRRVRRQTVAEQQEIRVLNAEWTYLNQPERLSGLNRRFLGLTAINTRQLQRAIDEIPLRAPPAPPEEVAAASPAPGAPQATPSPPAVTPPAVTPAAVTPAAVTPAAVTPAVLNPAVLNPAPAVSGPLSVASRATARDDGPAADPPRPPLVPASARPATPGPVQLAKAGPVETANSLDALIAHIVETR